MVTAQSLFQFEGKQIRMNWRLEKGKAVHFGAGSLQECIMMNPEDYMVFVSKLGFYDHALDVLKRVMYYKIDRW